MGSASSTRTDPQLFGSNGECEDIQTSLQKMSGYLDKLGAVLSANSNEDSDKPHEPDSESKLEMKPETKQDIYLTALRTKYGAGVSGCTEQVITLVDYYRDFERRTDLSEIWKPRITKLEKIESSLSEYVQFLNIPAALRQDFIKDLISYLRESWAPMDRRR
ncbi:metalloprotease family [Phytophthora cinnamomi]|uniref:metalloprotease family n=1 Tax=Phytophthora cinnamomi TaxID=4785 RepID=UPI00355A7872|nr:metalloprotease family [Phytophthora cinnamomi]